MMSLWDFMLTETARADGLNPDGITFFVGANRMNEKYPLINRLNLKVSSALDYSSYLYVMADDLEKMLSEAQIAYMCYVEKELKWLNNVPDDQDTHTGLCVGIRPIAQPQKNQSSFEILKETMAKAYGEKMKSLHGEFVNTADRLAMAFKAGHASRDAEVDTLKKLFSVQLDMHERLTQAEAKLEKLTNILEAIRSQMCWEADRDQLTMGFTDLHNSVTELLAKLDSADDEAKK